MTQMSDNMRGAMIMVVSMAGFGINDALIRTVLDHMPFYQTLTVRGAMLVVGLLLLGLVRGGLDRWPDRGNRVRIAWRSVAEFGAAMAFLTALTQMKFANLIAVLQALPLTVPLAAWIFLGQPMGWRRLVAIFVGLGGVMLILRPGSDAFEPSMLLGLVAVAFVTLRDVITRTISQDVPSVLVSLAASVAVLVGMGALSVTEQWEPFSLRDVFAMAASTVFLLIGFLSAVSAMRIGEIAAVTPFRYSSLLFALLIGWLAFDEMPDALALLGAAIVVTMGLFTLWREHVTQAEAQHQPDAPR